MKSIFAAMVYVAIICSNASALESEKIQLNKDTSGRFGADEVFVWNPRMSTRADLQAIGMSEAIADQLKALKDGGTYTCQGKIFGNQIFELSNCEKNKK